MLTSASILKQLKKRRLLILVVFAFLGYNVALPPPPYMWANTGAPGEVTCVSCHMDYPINSGGGILKITANPPFLNGHYVPGSTYQITEIFTQAPEISYQVSTEVVDSNGNNAGTMLITDSVSTYIEPSPTGRNCLWAGWYGTDTFFCRFNWLAPLSGIASFYAAGVVRTGPLGGSGGYVYSDSIISLSPGTSTGVPETVNKTSFSIFPNPAHNEIRIIPTADYKNEDIQEVAIYSLKGTRCFFKSAYCPVINLKSLPAGTYLISLKTTTGTISQKLVVD